MKTIKLGYPIYETREFNIPDSGEWKAFFSAWEKDEDSRTAADWDILDKHDLGDFVYTQIGINPGDDVDIYWYE